MDMFGIGSAVKSMMKIYSVSARHTGRTLSMVENVKNGDRIIFTNAKEANRVKRLIKEKGIDVECIYVPDYEFIMEIGTGQGRTILDHSWVEDFYASAIERANKDIDFFEKQLSGYGQDHKETKERAEKMQRWEI